jgi:hypothetical protein
VIRNAIGAVLHIVNTEVMGVENATNFAMAGDTLVIGDCTKVWAVKLVEPIISPGRFHT